MKVAVMGHQEVAESDLTLIAQALLPFLQDPDVDEFLFAAMEGASTLALAMAYDLVKDSRQKFTLVFPSTVETRPVWEPGSLPPWDAVPLAHKVVELGMPLQAKDGFKAHRKLGEYLVDQVADCGQLIAFWNGTTRSVTGRTVRYAQAKDVAWQHVPITGPEA